MTWKPSPNFTGGRTAKIDRIVIHWIVGTLASADATFANRNSQVSAHYGIENSTVHQYVKESDTAWHAMSANARSIGIEHSAAPGRNATALTIQTSAKLVADICKRYNIPIDRTHIIKHSDVVATQCPGTIPIDEIIKQAKEIGTKMIIQDAPNWFGRCDKTMYQIRGRALGKAEFKNHAVGAEFLNWVEAVSDNPEADTATRWQDVGRIATAEKWAIQISDLTKALAAKPKEVQVPVEVIKEVTVEKIVEVVKGDDDRSLGDLLSAALKKLFKIK